MAMTKTGVCVVGVLLFGAGCSDDRRETTLGGARDEAASGCDFIGDMSDDALAGEGAVPADVAISADKLRTLQDPVANLVLRGSVGGSLACPQGLAEAQRKITARSELCDATTIQTHV